MMSIRPDVVFPGEAMVEFVRVETGLKDAGTINDFYRGLGAEIAALKPGAKGCRLAWGNEQPDISAFPAKSVDFTGAGDRFAGAFLAHLLATWGSPRVAHCACAAAALTVSDYGAVDPIPIQREVKALLDRSGESSSAAE